MKAINKKEIEDTVEKAMSQAMNKLHVVQPSGKTKKAISKVSKKITKDLKKQHKNEIKKPTALKTKKVSPKNK
jgi:hypothetical protein